MVAARDHYISSTWSMMLVLSPLSWLALFEVKRAKSEVEKNFQNFSK